MKKIIMLLLLALVFVSCESIQENIDARRNLSKCKYQFIRVEPKSIKLDKANLKEINFNALFKITNTTKTDVAMDHIAGTIYLDNHKTATFSHKKFVKINPGKSSTETISLNVPFIEAMKSLGGKPKYIVFKAKVYMNLIIGKYTVNTNIPIDLEQKVAIPYSTIKKLIQKEAKKAVKNKNYKDLLNKLR